MHLALGKQRKKWIIIPWDPMRAVASPEQALANVLVLLKEVCWVKWWNPGWSLTFTLDLLFYCTPAFFPSKFPRSAPALWKCSLHCWFLGFPKQLCKSHPGFQTSTEYGQVSTNILQRFPNPWLWGNCSSSSNEWFSAVLLAATCDLIPGKRWEVAEAMFWACLQLCSGRYWWRTFFSLLITDVCRTAQTSNWQNREVS